MPTVNDLAQGRFLKKEDFPRPALLTISKYTRENIATASEKPDMQYCLHFDEVDKPLVLKSVNGQLIGAALKSIDFDDWIGKQIVLFADPTVMMGTKMVGGIRARAPKAQNFSPPPPKPKPGPAPAPVPEPEDTGTPADDDIPF